MAEVTTTGIQATTLAEWLAEFQGAFRTAFGLTLEFDASSVQQQESGILSEVCTEIDEAILAVHNGQSLDSATGYQLDFKGLEVGLPRTRSQPAMVTLTIGGVSGTVIDEGRRAQTSTGILFATTAAVTIPASGTIDVEAVAVITGVISVGANTITRVVDVVSGWETVNNILAASPGRDRDPDAIYRARIKRWVAHNAHSTLDAIESAVEMVSGVTKVRCLENSNDADATVDGVAVGAHSIYTTVQGGDNTDVAEAIYRSRTGGLVTNGGVTESLSRGTWTVDIKFSRPSATPVAVSLTITTATDFPSDGIARITQALLDLVRELDIGAPIYDGDAYIAVLAVPGHRVVGAIAIARKSGNDPVTTIAGNALFTLDAADITISTS